MSSTPPKPGIQALESFAPVSRLRSDSARSPISPARPTISAKAPSNGAHASRTAVSAPSGETMTTRTTRPDRRNGMRADGALPRLARTEHRGHFVPADQPADRIAPVSPIFTDDQRRQRSQSRRARQAPVATGAARSSTARRRRQAQTIASANATTMPPGSS